MNYQSWLVYAMNKLNYNNSAKYDAESLLQYVTKKTKTFIFAFKETELTFKEEYKLKYLLDKRINGEPIAYLIKEKEFWSLSIKVLPFTLIPRADTECLVEKALQFLFNKKSVKILDLGTGTGAVALALASECPQAQIIGIDIVSSAIKLAEFNAINLVINNIKFYKSNWFSSLSIQEFDMIVSNPPYIDKHDHHLKEGDLRFEPKIALISDNNGLADIKWIIKTSCNYLINKGYLLIEHGWLQGKQVRKLFYYYNYQKIITFKDYGGNDRITIGQFILNKNYY